MKKLACEPGTNLLAISPTTIKLNMIIPSHIHNVMGCEDNNDIITPSCAEHGIVKAMSIVAIILSRLVSRVRVVMVAILPQPTAKTIGIIERPLKPIFLKALSVKSASLGR